MDLRKFGLYFLIVTILSLVTVQLSHNHKIDFNYNLLTQSIEESEEKVKNTADFIPIIKVFYEKLEWVISKDFQNFELSLAVKHHIINSSKISYVTKERAPPKMNC